MTVALYILRFGLALTVYVGCLVVMMRLTRARPWAVSLLTFVALPIAFLLAYFAGLDSVVGFTIALSVFTAMFVGVVLRQLLRASGHAWRDMFRRPDRQILEMARVDPLALAQATLLLILLGLMALPNGVIRAVGVSVALVGLIVTAYIRRRDRATPHIRPHPPAPGTGDPPHDAG